MTFFFFKLYIFKVINLISFETLPQLKCWMSLSLPPRFLLHWPWATTSLVPVTMDCFAVLTCMLHAKLLHSFLTAYFLLFYINGISNMNSLWQRNFIPQKCKQLHVEHLAYLFSKIALPTPLRCRAVPTPLSHSTSHACVHVVISVMSFWPHGL